MKVKDPTQTVRKVLLGLFVAVLLLMVAAPFTLPSGSVTDLGGRVGIIDNGQQIAKMNPLAWLAYTIGDMNCHQLPDRSLFLNGNEMPVCARDIGIMMGLVIGMAAALLWHQRFRFLWAVLLFLPMLADGGLQAITSYQSTNTLRLITGLLAGIGASLLLSILADMRAGTAADEFLRKLKWPGRAQ
jgi:uncharacterized membrane protein